MAESADEFRRGTALLGTRDQCDPDRRVRADAGVHVGVCMGELTYG